jgi:Na+/melibiose symporter-like transporter
MKRSRSLWRHRDFMLLWSGQSISMTGTQVSQLAIPFVALAVLRASPLQISLLAAAGYLPYLLASLPAGAFVDRHRRLPMMLWCSLFQALTLGSVPGAAASGSLTLVQLDAVAFAVALLAVVFDAAYQSCLPSLLSANQLVEGNGKLGVSYAFAVVAGQSAAGGLITLLGAARTVGIDALSYLVSALSVLLIRTREPRPKASQAGTRMRTEIADGLRYVFGDRLMRPVLSTNALVSSAIGGVSVLWLVYVYRDLHWPAVVAGLCLGISAAGGVVGGLAAGRLADRVGLPRLMLLTAPAYMLDLVPTLLVGPGVAGQVLVTCGYCVAMTGEMIYVIANRSFRQLICPPGLLGRMNATSRWLSFGPKPVMAALFGLLATAASLWAALAIGAGLFTFAAVVLIVSPVRSLRQVPVHPAYAEA